MFLVQWANNNRSVEDTFLPASLILVQLSVSCLMALGITAAQVGALGVRVAVHPFSVMRCVHLAAFFYASKACTVAALGLVDPGTVQLSAQLILPCTAVLSVWLIAGREYSREQWVSIITICLGTLAFHAIQLEAEGHGLSAGQAPEELVAARQAKVAGLSLCGAVVIANSVGSVVGERFLKASGNTMPLASLKAQLVLAELFVVLLVLTFREGPRSGRGWFHGWDWRVLLCALGWVPSTWMSTIITARFSTVVKNIMQCVSTLLTYFIALVRPIDGGVPQAPAATPAALVVVLTVLTLALQSGKGEEPQQFPSRAGLEAGAFQRGRPRLHSAGPSSSRRHLPSSGMDSILDVAAKYQRQLDSAPVSRSPSACLLFAMGDSDFERTTTV